MSAVIHTFYDVPMGYSHKSLKAIMSQNANKEHLEKGELAVFMARNWMACKILTPGDMLLYYRSTVPLTTSTLKILPTLVGAPRLSFAGKVEASMMRAFEERFKEQMKSLKMAFA